MLCSLGGGGATIGHDDVYLAEARDGGADESGDGVELRDVGLHGEGAVGADLRDEGVGGGGVGEVVDDDGSAVGGEAEGDGFADAVGGAGDEGDFAGEGHGGGEGGLLTLVGGSGGGAWRWGRWSLGWEGCQLDSEG